MQARAHHLAEEMLGIADDDSGDLVDDGEGGKRVDYENIQRTKLRVETRKWLASKFYPRYYGEKSQVDVNHSGTVLHVLTEERRLDLMRRRREALFGSETEPLTLENGRVAGNPIPEPPYGPLADSP